MTDLYKGQTAKYWHDKFVKSTNAYLAAMVEWFRVDPDFKEMLFDELDRTQPGWREAFKGFMSGERRPFHPQEYSGD